MRGPGRGRLRRVPNGWAGDWKDASGKRHRQFLATAKGHAEVLLSEIIRRRDQERLGVQVEGGLDRLIEEVLEAYLRDLEVRATAKSKALRKAAVKRVTDYLGCIKVRQLTPAAIEDFRAWRLRKGASRATVNEDVLAVRAMLNYGVRLGLLAANPLAKVRLLPVEDRHKVRPPRALSDIECVKLLRACQEIDAKHPEWIPQEPLVLALLTTGARWGELTALTWEDVDFNTLQLTLQATKNGSERRIPLDTGLASRLASVYGGDMRAEGTVFRTAKGSRWSSTSNFRRYLGAALKKAGVVQRGAGGHVHVHALRHTFVTRMARAGVPLQQAQYLTGHKTARVLLEVYTHLDVESTREALRRLPPLGGSNPAGDARLLFRDGPKSLQDNGGPYWTRTSDLLDVNKTTVSVDSDDGHGTYASHTSEGDHA